MWFGSLDELWKLIEPLVTRVVIDCTSLQQTSGVEKFIHHPVDEEYVRF
jgi:hypothetical protein